MSKITHMYTSLIVWNKLLVLQKSDGMKANHLVTTKKRKTLRLNYVQESAVSHALLKLL